jgi:hypothetical protein
MPIINTFRFPEKNEIFKLGGFRLLGGIPSFEGSPEFTIPHPEYSNFAPGFTLQHVFQGDGITGSMPIKTNSASAFTVDVFNSYIYDTTDTTFPVITSWYTDSALTNKVTFPYTIPGPVVLYPKWAPSYSAKVNRGYNYNQTTQGFEYKPSVDGVGAVPALYAINILNEVNGVVVKGIANDALENREFTGTLNIPEGIQYIGTFAFNNNAFSSISLPSTLQSIGEYAFRNNNAYESISIPDGVQVGQYAFSSSTAPALNLKDIIIGENCLLNSDVFSSKTGSIENLIIGDNTVLNVNAISMITGNSSSSVLPFKTGSVQIGNNVTLETGSIGSIYSSNVLNFPGTPPNGGGRIPYIPLEMGNSLTIKQNAFYRNFLSGYIYTKLVLPYEEFEEYPHRRINFSKYAGSTFHPGAFNFVIPQIDKNAYSFAEGGIPAGFNDDEATWLVPSSTNIHLSGTGSSLDVRSFISNSNNHLERANVDLTEVIGDAFQDASWLFPSSTIPRLIIGENITVIPENAFRGSTIYTTASSRAFELQVNLATGLNTEIIKNGAFSGVRFGLPNVSFNEGAIIIEPRIHTIGTYIGDIANDTRTNYAIGAFSNIDTTSNILFFTQEDSPELMIGDFAFAKNNITSNTQTIFFPSDLFSTTPTLPQRDLKIIGHSAFRCSGGVRYTNSPVLIPPSVEKIGSHAFRGTGITALFFGGDNVSFLGQYAVADCLSLGSVEFRGTVNGGIVPDYLAFNSTNITLVNLLSGTTTVGVSSFEGANKIGSINIYGTTLTLIKSRAFYSAASNTRDRTINIYATTAPTVETDGIYFASTNGKTQTINVPVGATGYNVAPWTDYTVNYVL